MTRVKKGMNALKARKNTLRMVKGYRFRRSTNERAAFEAIAHAGKYAFAHRKDKKNDFRRLWTVRLNGALGDLSYSKFMGALKKKNIAIDRKILSALAASNPDTFQKIVAMAK